MTASNQDQQHAGAGGSRGRCDGSEIESYTDLMVETFETGLRASISLMKLPLAMTAAAVDCWARAVESALRECQPGDDRDGQPSAGGPARGGAGNPERR